MRTLTLMLFTLISFCLAAKELPINVNPNLKNEILQMRDEDQKARREYIDSGKDPKFKRKIEIVDKDHVVKLRAIIQLYNWPGIKLIGQDGSEAMWLLVQHTPDKALQRIALAKLKDAVAKKDASPQNLAYLEDKVLMQDEKLQLYGTQWVEEDGKHYLYPVENFGQVNNRRFAIGMNSIQDSRRQYIALYKLSEEDVLLSPP